MCINALGVFLLDFPKDAHMTILLTNGIFLHWSGVIGFIGILVVVVFILVGVVYLRFRCNHSKDAEGNYVFLFGYSLSRCIRVKLSLGLNDISVPG